MAGNAGASNRGHRRRLARQNRRDHAGLGLALKRFVRRGHFVEHCAKGKNIGADIGFLALQLLGRHVLEGAHQRAFGGERLGLGGESFGDGRGGFFAHLRQTEIQQLDAGLGDHDVGRFQITVHHAMTMRLIERARGFNGVTQQLVGRQRTTR